jgi:S-DNA-T family DNA segregation ATPase FtsK/SpoIIIE
MTTSNSRKRLQRELTAIICLFLAVFIGVCLVSYNSFDTSFNTAHSSGVKDVSNWGGLIGSYLADALFQLIGLTAFIVPVTLLWISLKLFLPAGIHMSYIFSVSYVILIVSLSVLCSLTWFNPRISLAFFSYDLSGGGLIGKQLAHVSIAYLNRLGSFIVFSLFGSISLIVMTNLSLLKIAQGLKKLFSWSVLSVMFLRSLLSQLIASIKKLYRSALGLMGVLAGLYDRFISQRVRSSQHEDVTPAPHSFPEAESVPKTPRRKTAVRKREEPPGNAFPSTAYQVPPLSLLDNFSQKVSKAGKEALRENAKVLENKLADFGVQGKVVAIHPGPVITRYEFEPASGVRISKILGLADDLALALKALGVRILAPVPGKAVVGIEIPNAVRETVYFKEIVGREEFTRARSRLSLALGKDIAGNAIISDLAKMPHLLVAGSTGSGKSVLINALICSILYKSGPSEVKMLLIDPKRLELSFYEDIPHLLHPVVTDPKKAALALQWTVGEMERRYQKLADKGVRDIDGYNQRIEADRKAEKGSPTMSNSGEESTADDDEKLPYILVVIDELADLMMVSSREVEMAIARLAQMARASGIHLLVATQRPSVDVLTGTIKVNFSARISFQVSSKIDSRTIVDTVGAERLLGLGDMLFLPPGTSNLVRVHGTYLSEAEIRRITAFLRKQARPTYNQSIMEIKEESTFEEDDDYDERYDDAVALVAQTRTASISMVQRRLRIGYNRAARIIERMEREKVVGPSDGVKPREVLIKRL